VAAAVAVVAVVAAVTAVVAVTPIFHRRRTPGSVSHHPRMLTITLIPIPITPHNPPKSRVAKYRIE
jgi:hypothetical protein